MAESLSFYSCFDDLTKRKTFLSILCSIWENLLTICSGSGSAMGTRLGWSSSDSTWEVKEGLGSERCTLC